MARMDKLAFLCLAVAIVGTAALYFWAQSLAPRAISAAEVDLVQPGSYVAIAGIIEEISEKEKTFSIKVCDTSGCTTVTIFKSLVRNIFFFEGNDVVVHGVVRDYAGRRHIEVKSSAGIKVLS